MPDTIAEIAVPALLQLMKNGRETLANQQTQKL